MNLSIDEYGQAGNEQTVVILHGLFGSSDNWRGQATELSLVFRVLVPDLPNHGRSPHTDRADIPFVADSVLSELRRRGVQRAHWLGHSFGGKIAMAVALRNSEAVDRLIVADIAPKRYAPRHSQVFAALEAAEAGSPKNRGDAERLMTELLDDRAVRLFLLKSFERAEDGRFQWTMNVPVLKRDYQAISDWPITEGTFDGPALFIRGERSTYIVDADLPTIRSQFPNSRIETIADAGHWLHAEKKEQFLQMVSAFLTVYNPPV